jgi:competence protein ComEC
MLFFGIARVNILNETNQKSSALSETSNIGVMEARLIEPPNQKKMTTGFVVEITGIQGIKQTAREKVLVYLQNYPDMPKLEYGSFILIGKPPEAIAGPLNPEQFNYKSYLSLKAISFQVYLKKGEWELLSGSKTNIIFKTAYWCRGYLLDVLKNNGLQGDEYAVASAILLGYDEELPRYLRKGYVASGTMHVLCVSGLHVGIIYLIFNYLLGLVIVKKSGQTIKILLLLGIVWFYAMITGLTPSVLRSTIMISFILIGTLIKKKGNIVNSLAASAFLLLLIDPATLLNIGFQLSYLAVLGIALFQQPIYNLLYFKNKVINWIWEATSVTLAAQLMTTPIILYYFHQFPVYFIISNLILIPLSFGIIVIGMAVLLLSFLPWIPLMLGYVTSAFIYLMNFLVSEIEKLPLSTIEGLFLTRIEVVLLFIIIGLLWFYFNINRFRVVLPIMVVGLFFMVSVTYRNIQNFKLKQIVVYGVNKHTAIDLIAGKQHILLSDSTLKVDEYAIDYNIRAYWAKIGLKQELANPVFFDEYIVPGLLYKKSDLTSFGGKLFSIWDGNTDYQNRPNDQLPIDFAVIVGNRKESLNALLKNYLVNQIIIDLSVPYWQANKWKSAAEKLGIQVYDIREKGAYMIDL